MNTKFTICQECGSLQDGRTCLVCAKQHGEDIDPFKVTKGRGTSKYFPMMYKTKAQPKPKVFTSILGTFKSYHAMCVAAGRATRQRTRDKELMKLGAAPGQTKIEDFL